MKLSESCVETWICDGASDELRKNLFFSLFLLRSQSLRFLLSITPSTLEHPDAGEAAPSVDHSSPGTVPLSTGGKCIGALGRAERASASNFSWGRRLGFILFSLLW